MTKNPAQINELLRAELAGLIEREIEFPEALVTVTYVDCSEDLRQTKIGISVLPEKFTGSILKKLKNRSGTFSRQLIKRTRLRKIPRLDWRADDTEAKAAEIEAILKNIK